MEEKVALGLLWYLVFLFSVTFHEAAHAFAAWRMGDQTAYQGGQVSLNPLPHMMREPFGMMVVPVLFLISSGFPIGWASTPYDVRWALQYPRRSSLMALAGPASNFLLFMLALLASRYMIPDEAPFAVREMLRVLGVLNLILFLFNLMPVPPMDGAGVIGLFMPEEMVRKFSIRVAQPGIAIIGLLSAWFVFPHLLRLAMDYGLPALHSVLP